MKYFIDEEIYYRGEKQPPRKVYLPVVIPNKDGKTALCYDEDGADYTLSLEQIRE